MTNKIYLVISYWGEYPEEYEEIIERAFLSFEKAQKYMEKLEHEEELLRAQAERCRNCVGSDVACPLYAAPDYLDDICESDMRYRSNEHHRIDEVEYEE